MVAILGTQITLWCLRYGRSGSFPITIGENNSIYDLKKAVLEKIGLHNVSAIDLSLWNVNFDEGNAPNELLEEENKLKLGTRRVGETFYEVQGDNIRVVVKAPDTASVENMAGLFGQMNVSGAPADLLTKVMDSLNENSETIKANSEIMKKSMEVMNKTSKIMDSLNENSETIKANSEIMKKSLEVMNKTSKIMDKTSEVLIRLDRNNRTIPGVQDYTAYQSISFEKVDQEYFLCETGSQLGKFAKNKSVSNYLNHNPVPTQAEEKVQTWFNNLMEALPKFKKNLVVKDTHKKAYLDGYMPNFSVFYDEDITDNAYVPMSVHTLLEVKKRKSSTGFADEDKGQILDYINILIQQQPLRELFALFLSDGFYFYVMAFDRKVNQYREFMTTFRIGLRLFWVLLHDGSPFTKMSGPRSANFCTSPSNFIRIRLKKYLGTGSSSTVYMIDKDGTPSVMKMFKHGFKPNDEVDILRFLNERNVRNIPRYIAHDHNSMITTPVGEQISYQFRQHHALQLLDLLRCIHNLKVFHRDVRPSNILLDISENVILVDWGSAIREPSNEQVPYEGTISFASPDILTNDLGFYYPKASDDLHSFIRTLFILHDPRELPIIPDGDLSIKAQTVSGYWKNKLDGELWTEMVDAANNENYDILKKCCYIFSL